MAGAAKAGNGEGLALKRKTAVWEESQKRLFDWRMRHGRHGFQMASTIGFYLPPFAALLIAWFFLIPQNGLAGFGLGVLSRDSTAAANAAPTTWQLNGTYAQAGAKYIGAALLVFITTACPWRNYVPNIYTNFALAALKKGTGEENRYGFPFGGSARYFWQRLVAAVSAEDYQMFLARPGGLPSSGSPAAKAAKINFQHLKYQV